MLNLKSQRGAAIIVALFVVSLVVIAATAMIERLSIDLRRTELILNNTQSQLYAEGSVAWAMAELNNNWKTKKSDGTIDKTPIASPISKEGESTIYSVIYDQEGLFNLNNLTNLDFHDHFIKLIRTVHPDTDAETARAIVLAIRDWISPGSHSALDDYYAKQTPPYRSPHRLMASVSELRLVKNMTPDRYMALLPYITALPEMTKININHAPPEVLMSISPSMTIESARAIETYRKQTPFPTLTTFMQFDTVKNNPIKESQISLNSSYFLVKTSVKVGEQETVLYTLLHRLLKNSQPIELVLWQSKGTL